MKNSRGSKSLSVSLALTVFLAVCVAACGGSSRSAFSSVALDGIERLNRASEETAAVAGDAARTGELEEIADAASDLLDEVEELADDLDAPPAPPSENELKELVLETLDAYAVMLERLDDVLDATMDGEVSSSDLSRLTGASDDAAEAAQEVEDEFPDAQTEGLLALCEEIAGLAEALEPEQPGDGDDVIPFDPRWGDPMLGASDAVFSFLADLISGDYARAAGHLGTGEDQLVMEDHIGIIELGLLESFEIYDASELEPAIWRIDVRFFGAESAVEAWYEVQPTELGYFISGYTFDFYY
ncbi:MAG: hypothetical protein ACYC55_05720 [Candidatus Geothermincolia bacterium]